MRISFYIDGFNFYYSRLKNRKELKWLNLHELAYRIATRDLSATDLHLTVNFFTAYLPDGESLSRQKEYIRALKTISAIQVNSYGYFKTNDEVYVRLQKGSASPITAYRHCEKCSDVNLAVKLITDACHKNFDVAYLLSNDTDQAGTLKAAKQEGGLVKLISPFPERDKKGRRNHHPKKLKKHLTDKNHTLYIKNGELNDSQFPDKIYDQTGALVASRPVEWGQTELAGASGAEAMQGEQGERQ